MFCEYKNERLGVDEIVYLPAVCVGHGSHKEILIAFMVGYVMKKKR